MSCTQPLIMMATLYIAILVACEFDVARSSQALAMKLYRRLQAAMKIHVD